jgi:uncharacterized Zn-finger protein
MSEVVFSISIPSDDDGFITLQCPFCNDRFKLSVEDVEREDIIEIFCPYCGLQNKPSSFLTDEVVEQAQRIAKNYAKSLLNQFSKDLEKKFKSSKHISVKAGKPLEMENDKVLFEREELELTQLECCQSTVKVSALAKQVGVYCPFCGFN